ncbi:MAG: chemotaxis protein CheW [SAR324 cluster bacterium]|nr:chemotaxis protein CheW [SAR324 cluster bacterium]
MENQIVVATKNEVTTTKQSDLYVSFWIEEELFGINIIDIKEVTQLLDITPIFHAPSEVKGYVNLRGEIHMILDFRHMMGLVDKEPAEKARIIIFKTSVGEPFGILVDHIGEVVSVTADQIEPRSPSDTLNTNREDLISGVCKLDGKLMIMVNCSNLLNRG